jgi:hypothetical protein
MGTTHHTKATTTAEIVARELGVDVLAPNGVTKALPDGSTVVAPASDAPAYKPGISWILISPDGNWKYWVPKAIPWGEESMENNLRDWHLNAEEIWASQEIPYVHLYRESLGIPEILTKPIFSKENIATKLVNGQIHPEHAEFFLTRYDLWSSLPHVKDLVNQYPTKYEEEIIKFLKILL